MVKKPIFIDDLSGSPLPSPTPLLTSSLLNKVPGSALAERILNDPEAWKLLEDDDGSITDLRLPLDSSDTEGELTRLENEIKALNLPSPSSMFGEKLASQVSDTNDPFNANSLQITSNHPETPAAPNTRSMQQRRASPKPRPIDLLSPYIYNPPGNLDEPRQSNEGPQEADLHVRLSHCLLGRTDETGPLMRTVPVTDSAHGLSPPSSESSSNSSLSSGRGFHPPDDRTTQARPTCFALGPPSPTSGSTSQVASPLMVHSASTTLSFLEWYGIYIDSRLGKAAFIGEYQSLTRATTVRQSEGDLSQSRLLPGEKCDGDAAPRLSGADSITSPEIEGQRTVTQTTAETYSSISSKVEEKKCTTDVKSTKRLALYARGPPKPMPILPLPTVPNVTSPIILPKDRAPPTYAQTGTSREMTSDSSIRRLPVAPTRSATLSFESKKASPLVGAPLPAPPHTNVHTLRRSNTNTFGKGAPQTPCRSGAHTPIGFDITPTATSNPSTTCSTSSTKSPPCPVGPRNRHRRNNTTSFKSAWQDKNNTSVRVLRSVPAPKVSPPHGLK